MLASAEDKRVVSAIAPRQAWSRYALTVLQTCTHGLVLVALVLMTLAQAAYPQMQVDPAANPEPVVLTVQNDRLSLSATQASFKAIFEEIGRQMQIAVRVEIPTDERATLAFERLTLPEVIERLGQYVNYAYIESQDGKVTAIMVYGLRGTPSPMTPMPRYERQRQRTTPALELEIDPKQFLGGPSQ